MSMDCAAAVVPQENQLGNADNCYKHSVDNKRQTTEIDSKWRHLNQLNLERIFLDM